MNNSLSWIEWLDRLDRVLTSARRDVLALARSTSPRALAAIDRSRRQLAALINDLGLLDRNVLPRPVREMPPDPASGLKAALDAAHSKLGTASDRERVLGAIDSALRDALYEAAMLLEPRRRRA
jgi:hypothetical protein